VKRGIATGANDFFFLTRSRAHGLGLLEEFLIPAIGRTRDVTGDEITAETMLGLESLGRPTLLFAPDGRPLDEFSSPMRSYLEYGVAMGLSEKPLLRSRRPWYKMETRQVPPFLFAYLGRRSARFIRNVAGVVPLSGFLCVYPRSNDPEFWDRLWLALSDSETVAMLHLVGKSYGSGAIKVEPRALERLPLPPDVMTKTGILSEGSKGQLQLAL